MIFPEKEIILKGGRKALLRSPRPEDAGLMLQYMVQTAQETPFLLRTPEEVTQTLHQEQVYLENLNRSGVAVMLVCFVDGKMAGNCTLSRKTKLKNRHRGSIGIALMEEFWGLGIGTAMFLEMEAIARSWGLYQLELEVIEGNHRAMGLYRKMGFQTVSFVPNAIRMPDGTFAKEYLMTKLL